MPALPPSRNNGRRAVPDGPRRRDHRRPPHPGRGRYRAATAALIGTTGQPATRHATPPATARHPVPGPRHRQAARRALAPAHAVGDRATRTTRVGDIAFAVRTSDGRFYGYRPDHVEWSASVVKAMLMVVYLDEPSVRGRALTAHERDDPRPDDHASPTTTTPRSCSTPSARARSGRSPGGSG